MIFKILGIKNNSPGTIARVLSYISEDKGRIFNPEEHAIYHNLMHTDLDLVAKEFENNYTDFATARAGGNIAIHVVVAHSPLNSDKLTPEMMDEIVREFLEYGYGEALAYSNHHLSEYNLHSHALISANLISSKIGTRLSKDQLRDMHEHMREFVKERYPELDLGFDMKNYGKKLNNSKAYHTLKRNPDLVLDKDALANQVQSIFKESLNTTDFYQKLEEQGHETYEYMNETKGIFWQDGKTGTFKKMRFTRLGLTLENFHALNRQDDRLKEIEDLRNGDYHRELEQEQEAEVQSIDEVEIEMEQDEIEAQEDQAIEEIQVEQPSNQIQEIDMGQP